MVKSIEMKPIEKIITFEWELKTITINSKIKVYYIFSKIINSKKAWQY